MKIPDQLKDKKWLEEQYLNQQKSEYEIGDELGVSRTTVFRWRTKHKIPARKSIKK